MKNRNICKFIPVSVAENLEVVRFICESDEDVMKRQDQLQENRVILIKQGRAKININGKEYCVGMGDLIFVLKSEHMSVAPYDRCEYMYIDFGGARGEVLFRRFLISESNRFFEGFDGLIPLWHDSLCRANSENIDLASESVLLYTFSRLSMSCKETNSLTAKILEITEERFTDSELTIPAIAEELSYSAKYLSHVFKQKMGIGYSEYLRNLRIKYAVSLFEHGIDSVKNVAYLSGFTDRLYFSTIFKKVIGVSPKEYKLRIKGE